MRVLIAAPWFRTIAESHHSALTELGHEVRTVTTDAQSGRVVAPLENVTVLNPRLRGNLVSRELISLVRETKAWSPDVVILDATWDVRFILLSMCGKKVSTAIHDPTPHDKSHTRSGWKRIAESYSRRISDRNLFYSEYSKLTARSAVPGSVLALPSELKSDSISAAPVSDRNGAAFVGRLSEYKGFDVLLKAWGEIDPDLRKENPLTVLSSGAPPPPIPFDDVNITAGTYSDAQAIQVIRSAKVLVLPYREASQSSVQVLAQQLGTPTVVTKVGALPEMQPSGHPVVPAEDATALATEISHILRAPDWQRLSDEAIAFFEKTHSNDAVTSGLANALEAL